VTQSYATGAVSGSISGVNSILGNLFGDLQIDGPIALNSSAQKTLAVPDRPALSAASPVPTARKPAPEPRSRRPK
jgi:hypothetical protein